MFFWFIKIICYIPFWLMFPIIVKGKKNLPKGKCVLISNHLSNIDPLILVNMIWKTQHCITKQELYKNKLLAWFLKNMKAIPINREKVELSTIKSSLKVLKEDKILTIFPEGTRNKTDEPLAEIKGGAGIFAIKGEAPVVPVWFSKTPKLFRLNTLTFGEPFYLTKEDSQNSDEIIRNKLLELREKTITKK